MPIMFIESPQGTIHISLRSKNVVDVSEIALKFGGGHARAAVCSLSNTSLEQLMDDVISQARQWQLSSHASYINRFEQAGHERKPLVPESQRHCKRQVLLTHYRGQSSYCAGSKSIRCNSGAAILPNSFRYSSPSSTRRTSPCSSR